jgi:hypothetical protein
MTLIQMLHRQIRYWSPAIRLVITSAMASLIVFSREWERTQQLVRTTSHNDKFLETLSRAGLLVE